MKANVTPIPTEAEVGNEAAQLRRIGEALPKGTRGVLGHALNNPLCVAMTNVIDLHTQADLGTLPLTTEQRSALRDTDTALGRLADLIAALVRLELTADDS
jgi:hypothetical protein